jgi:DNA-binding NtrC family response regulator
MIQSGQPAKRFRVLVVDDDEATRRSVEGVLGADVDVVTSPSASHALKVLGEPSGRFHVVCSDYTMPGMNGVELLRKVAALDPLTSLLLFTGNDEYFRAERNADFYVVAKPFDPVRLIAIVLQLARICDLKRSSKPTRTGSMPGSR